MHQISKLGFCKIQIYSNMCSDMCLDSVPDSFTKPEILKQREFGISS